MDNNSVEMQAKENNPKKNGRIAVCCCIVAAICIVVATVLVMHLRSCYCRYGYNGVGKQFGSVTRQ